MNDKTLNKRQKDIISILANNQTWIKGKQLAQLAGVSDRTIRSDIDAINKYYQEEVIASHMRKGYILDNERYRHFKDDISHNIPQTPQQRYMYILQQLLIHEEGINLTFLQGDIYVSGYSIENDLKKVRNELNKYKSLHLERIKNYIYLKGEEIDKRQLYKELLAQETQGNFLNLNNLAKFYKDFDLIKAIEILVEILKKHHYTIKESMFSMLILHVGISIERIMHSQFYKTETSQVDIQTTVEYQIAKEFYEKLQEIMELELHEDEISLLALLISNKSGQYTPHEIRIQETDIDIGELIIQLIEPIEKKLNIEFLQDPDFFSGMKMHLQGLIDRYNQNVTADDIFVQDIKKNYPLLFEMGVTVGKALKDLYGITINESEMCFIALHFGATYERLSCNSKLKAVIISPYDQNLTHLCQSKITNIFDERLHIVATLNYFEEAEIRAINPDLIITLTPLSHELNILTIQVSTFINSVDESTIFQAISQLEKKRYQSKFNQKISQLINPEYFYIDLEQTTSTEVIEYMCDQLYQGGLVDQYFKQSVMKREEMSPTSFIYSFATPHALSDNVVVPTISVAILKNPVDWGPFKVKLVILLAINEEDHDILKIFFDWISNAIGDADLFSGLLEARNYQEFILKITKN
ncbi:BglG family transcription antiterminator [[Clostridium] spiroforme]|nr:BglG family transcription antiterminator [Thomasclavelia spiroformis]